MDSFLDDVLAVNHQNHHLANSICGSLLDNKSDNDSKNDAISQQPLTQDKIALFKSTTPQQWSENYGRACQVNKSADYLRAALDLPTSMFSSAQYQRKCVIAIYRSAIKSVARGDMSNTVAKNIVTVLQQGCEDLCPDDIPAVVEAVYSPLVSEGVEVEGSVSGALNVFELLPLLLNIVAAKSTELDIVETQLRTDISGMNGAAYVEHVVVEISRLQWPSGWHIKLVECFKDMSLPSKLLGIAVTKSVKQLDKVAIEELPALTYQLLLLGSQQNGAHRDQLVVAVLERFHSLDPLEEESRVLSAGSNNDRTRAIVGNVVQFFNFAATQDHGLGSTLLKSIDKIDSGFSWLRLTPFAATLALSIMQAQRFQQKVIDVFLKLVADGSKHRCRLKASPWLDSTAHVTAAHTSGRGSHGGHVSWVLSRVVATNSGWDRITPALVQLGMAFIDKAPSVELGFLATVESNSVEADMGVTLLRQIYLTNASARDTILSKILERMLTRGGGVRYVLSLLEELVVRCPLDLLQQSTSLREMFSFLGEIKPRHSEELLRICCPLFVMQPSASDMAMLPLRKSLFSRSEPTRVMAASGLINLLSVAGSSLRVQDGSLSQMDSAENGISVEEIMTLLRRCLTQQCVVRKMVYSGLTDCFQKHPSLRRYIYSFVSSHLRRFMVVKEGRDQFDLDLCISANPLPHVAEPLGHLVACASQIISEAEVDDSPALKQELGCIAKQLESIDLSDYLDNPLAQARGEHDRCRIVLLKSVMEACMLHVVNCNTTDGKLGEEALLSVVSLFQHYEVLPTLMEAVVEKSSSSSSRPFGKKEEGDNDEDGCCPTRKTCFSLQSTVLVLQSLTEEEEGLARCKNSLRRLMLQVAISELSYASNRLSRDELSMRQGETSDYNARMMASAEKVRQVTLALGPLLFKAYRASKDELGAELALNRDEVVEGGTQPKGKGKKAEKSGNTTPELALLGFQTATKLMVAAARVISTKETELNSFYDIVRDFVWSCFSKVDGPSGETQNSLNVIAKGVKSLIKHVAQFCSSESNGPLNQRLALGALDCILTFTSAIPPSELNGVAKKMKELCQGHSAPSVRLCQELTRGFIACHGGAFAPSLDYLTELSNAVLGTLGTSFQDDDDSQLPELTFKLVAERGGGEIKGGRRSMAGVVAEMVSEALDKSIKDVEYSLVILKRLPKPSEKQKAQGDEEEDSTHVNSEERNNCDKLCERLVDMMGSLLPLCKCKLDPGKYLERILVVVRKVYDSVGKLVKFLIDHKTLWLSKSTKLMLGLSAEHFTPNVYQFIQHTMESGQADRLQLASQGKLVPLIVERMEFVDLQLVTLGRMCVKTDDVHSFIVRSSARDFKIDLSALQLAQTAADEKSKRKKEQKTKKIKKSKTETEQEEDVEEEEVEEEDADLSS